MVRNDKQCISFDHSVLPNILNHGSQDREMQRQKAHIHLKSSSTAMRTINKKAYSCEKKCSKESPLIVIITNSQDINIRGTRWFGQRKPGLLNAQQDFKFQCQCNELVVTLSEQDRRASQS